MDMKWGRRPHNPALGLRGIRRCLKDPALLRVQLRAILRASAHGPVQLCIPMLTGVDELSQVLAWVERVKQELMPPVCPMTAACRWAR